VDGRSATQNNREEFAKRGYDITKTSATKAAKIALGVLDNVRKAHDPISNIFEDIQAKVNWGYFTPTYRNKGKLNLSDASDL